MKWSSLQKRMSKFKAHLHGNVTLAYECRKKFDNIGTMCQCYKTFFFLADEEAK
jgi:hypothetical protein